ncbi:MULTISPECIES: hypothetical protein [unclassified Yoonia]|uniref:hypothetical protein n=1 Tax=unclassified Yoonia TaxID=2629118 RepID=UPI002AFFC2F8|nr:MULTISPECIES: hypothetical protein [unclassified Yoonia]
MAAKSKIFGYWISSVDEKSAKEAAKMAGLPVLLLGANALILALSGLVNQSASMTVAGSYLTMALCLSFIAFRIRAGHAGWIPLAGLLFLVFIAVSVCRLIRSGKLAGPTISVARRSSWGGLSR